MFPSSAMSLDDQDEMIQIFEYSLGRLTEDIQILAEGLSTCTFSREKCLQGFQIIYDRLKADWIIDDDLLASQGIPRNSDLNLLAQKILPVLSSRALRKKLFEAFHVVERLYSLFADRTGEFFYLGIGSTLYSLAHFLAGLSWESSQPFCVSDYYDLSSNFR